jgi:hypothetical protein
MDESTEAPAGRRLVPLVFMGLGLLLLMAGVSWLAVDRLVIGQGTVPVPDSLVGLPLSERATGRPALAEIERLHGKGFFLVDGSVARYGGGTATLWVSSTWTPFLAAGQVEAMTNRIAEGRSPFTPSGTREVEDTAVYALTGMGQMHYYFQIDKQVIWLSVSPPLAEQVLGELIRNVR